MKNTLIDIALALVLVLALGIVAFAATAESTMEPVPALTEEVPAEDTTAEAPAADAAQTDDGAALREAMEAYRNARESKRVDDLTEELNGYVAAGTMTQEQADLILNNVKERQAAKNGARMGGHKGQRGGRMMQGGQMNGNRMQGQMNGQQAPQW